MRERKIMTLHRAKAIYKRAGIVLRIKLPGRKGMLKAPHAGADAPQR